MHPVLTEYRYQLKDEHETCVRIKQEHLITGVICSFDAFMCLAWTEFTPYITFMLVQSGSKQKQPKHLYSLRLKTN